MDETGWFLWWSGERRWHFVVDTRPPASHRWALTVDIELLDPDPEGRPRPTEHLFVQDVQARLIRALVDEHGAQVAAIQVGDGRLSVLAYLTHAADWRTIVGRILERSAHHPWRGELAADPERLRWEEVAPSLEVFRQSRLWDAVRTRWLRGDAIEQVRPVTLTLAAPSADARQLVAAAVVALGFTLDDFDDGVPDRPFGLDVVRELAPIDVPSVVTELGATLAPLGAEVVDFGAPDVPIAGRDEAAAVLTAELQALLDRVAALGVGERVVTHRAVFETREERAGFATAAERIGLEVSSEPDPPDDLARIGLPWGITVVGAQPVGLLTGIVLDLEDLARHHGGRYDRFDAEQRMDDALAEPPVAPILR